MKAACLITEKTGLNAPFTRYASLAASGTVTLCTSETESDRDVKALYDNLKALLRHFSLSNKSTGLLNNKLSVLGMNNIHILNWGSTSIAEFLDTCFLTS